MGIVLIVAVLIVAVAVLYVTITLSTRTRQSTAPLIDDAVTGVSGRIDTAAQDLRRQIADERQHDMEQLRQEVRRTQGRLDHLDERASGMTSQVLAELDTIRRLVEQLGGQQDQLGTDLGKLDHRVARLGESLARPSAPPPPAVPPSPQQTPAAGAGQLYAERLRFSFAAVQPDSSSRPERQYRVQVERQIGALLSPQPGALNDPSTIIHRAENDEAYRQRLSEAARFATKLGDPDFAVATERWITQNAYPETALAEVCNRISSGLDTIVEKPIGKIGTELRLPGPEAAKSAGIGPALILRTVTEPLAQAAAFLEITGVVVGQATGLRPLALVAAKMLAHDQFHDFVARPLMEAARQVFEGPPRPGDDRRPLRPVAEASASGQAPTVPVPPPPRVPPPASGPPSAQPQPNSRDPDRDDGPPIRG